MEGEGFKVLRCVRVLSSPASLPQALHLGCLIPQLRQPQGLGRHRELEAEGLLRGGPESDPVPMRDLHLFWPLLVTLPFDLWPPDRLPLGLLWSLRALYIRGP